MLDLSEHAMAAWAAKLPDDVRAVISGGDEASPEGSGGLRAALASAPPSAVPGIVRGDADGARALGRAGRLRLMAWMAASEERPGAVFSRLVGEGEGEGEDSEGAPGGDPVGILFLEDLKAIAEAVVGPRMSRRMVDDHTLGAVAEAAATLESDMAFRQGGI